MEEQKKGRFGTALVLGGCGYLGCHIVEALHSDGSFTSIVGASRNPRRWRIAEAVYKSFDITDGRQIQELLDEVKPEVVFHSVAPSANESDKVQYSVNYASTKQVLEIARQHAAVRAFVYTGSARSIASESETRSTPLTEDIAILHNLSSNGSGYERTKGAADALTLAMNTPDTRDSSSRGFEGVLLTAVIRVPALYGRRDFRTSARLLQRVNTRGALTQIGDNKAKHEWLYFDNAARAHVLAAKALLDQHSRPPNARVDGEAFFITDGAPIKFWDFSRMLWAAAGDTQCTDLTKIRRIPMPFAVFIATIVEWTLWIFTLGRKKTSLSAAQLRYIDRGSWWSIEKARERLGYEPICDTNEGVRRTVEWFKHSKEV